MVTTGYWELVLEEAKNLQEVGPMAREEVLTLWRWDQLKVNLLQDLGLAYRGESFKNQGWSTLMVLKVARDMTPLVAFITERTARGCIAICLRQIDEERLELRDDKFA